MGMPEQCTASGFFLIVANLTFSARVAFKDSYLMCLYLETCKELCENPRPPYFLLCIRRSELIPIVRSTLDYDLRCFYKC